MDYKECRYSKAIGAPYYQCDITKKPCVCEYTNVFLGQPTCPILHQKDYMEFIVEQTMTATRERIVEASGCGKCSTAAASIDLIEKLAHFDKGGKLWRTS